MACFLLAIPEYALSLFNARTKFISGVVRIGLVSSLAGMILDRGEFLLRGLGWNSELVEGLRDYIDLRDVDLLNDDEIAEAREDLGTSLVWHGMRRFKLSSSSFVLDFFPSAIMPRDFASFLKDLPYEAVRILLIFFANQFQFTYLRSTNMECPFCSGQVSSRHPFVCPHTPPPYNDWSALTSEFQARDYWSAVDCIFLTLQRWASFCQNFAQGFADKVELYFSYTESQSVCRNAAVLALQLRIHSLQAQ